jgi:serine protease AprX
MKRTRKARGSAGKKASSGGRAQGKSRSVKPAKKSRYSKAAAPKKTAKAVVKSNLPKEAVNAGLKMLGHLHELIAPAAMAMAAAPTPRRRVEGAVYARAATVGFAPGLASLVAASPALTETSSKIVQNVSFTVTPTTYSKEPIQAQRGALVEKNLEDFRPQPDAAQAAAERLKQLGFSILRMGRFGITASGPADLVKEALKVNLAIHARPRREGIRATQSFSASFAPPRTEDLFVAPTESLSIASNVSEHIDHFVFTPPPLFFAPPSADPPAHTWNGVDDARIRKLLKVPAAATGAGVKVAIVDTGFFPHPYYAKQNLNFVPTPTVSAPNPQNDTYGHGTAIPYNVFSVAPQATVLGFQQTDPPQNALEDAADAGVDVISCSWGWDYEQSFPVLEATIRDIVNEGKIVCFACGNGQQAWPGSMPDVLSVGGVFANENDALEASNYASGYTSNLYPGRKVPDVSGLCGMQPKAVYIMMPCPPGCTMDVDLGGSAFPNGDGGSTTDGWVGASGTSSATPQVAGVAALLVERARQQQKVLKTADVRKILQDSALSVQAGRNFQGFPATGQPNVAVGYGLVDAGKALALV